MRTEIIEKTYYNYADLLINSELKRKAIDRYLNNYDDCWSSERQDSYKKIIKSVYEPLKEVDELKGIRLYKWIQNNLSWLWIDKNRISKHTDGKNKNSYFWYKYNCIKYRVSKVFITNNLENCPFTGVCYDFDFLEPIIDFLKKPNKNTTAQDLCDSMPSLNDIAQRDYDYYTSDECILETFQANGYEFDENGKIVG